jgi:hypothetical protein
MRSGFSTNHIATLRVLSGPTTQSRECSLGARNSMSPSPSVTIAKASTSLLFHTAPSPLVFVHHHELADSTTSPVGASRTSPRRHSPTFARPDPMRRVVVVRLVRGGSNATPRSTSPSAPIAARNVTQGVVPTCVGPPEGGRTVLLGAAAARSRESAPADWRFPAVPLLMLPRLRNSSSPLLLSVLLREIEATITMAV